MSLIKISSSSFLIPQNNSWSSLSKKYDVEFGEYGDWGSSLLKQTDHKELALVLFIDDFIQGQILTRDDALKVFRPFLQLLSNRLKRTGTLTIVAIASLDDTNPINSSTKVPIKSYIQRLVISELEILANRFDHFLFADLDQHFGFVGLKKIIDNRNWYFARCRISNLGLQVCAQIIEELIFRKTVPPAKVLVLDCDNTIWGGVVGESGVGNLILGQDGLGKAFQDFQFEVSKIIRSGIILCLASKNNEDDVWRVFDNHNGMILKKNDVTSWRINWEDKSKNILDMARELNLSADSFVFWDDNPLERAKVSMACPDVVTVDVPKDVCEWPSVLRRLNNFSKLYISDEDIKKTQQYKSRNAFISGREKVADELSYLKSIKLQPSLTPITESNIKRASQMCSKTNQFNLRTSRHSENDIRVFLNEKEDFAFMIQLTDIYGDHGLISLVILSEINNQSVFIETFLMSCRVLGRYLEAWIIEQIVVIAKKHGYTSIVGEFKPSSKNNMCENFFKTHNFEQIDKNDVDIVNKPLFKLDGIVYSAQLEDIVIPNIEVYNE